VHAASGREDEQRLIAAARQGDVDAYGELVRRHQRAAVRVAALAAGDAADAEDAAQEAFVRAYRALGGFRTGQPFRPWLLRIVANTARNGRRSARRRHGVALRVAALAVVPGDAPVDVATGREDRRRLLDALNRLNADDRLILSYRWFEQLSEVEIATALGCRPGTVKSRLSRAMGRLRAELGAGPGAGIDEGRPEP
jgi:RNA polymerase sigma-70 factor (ECF subfamily)